MEKIAESLAKFVIIQNNDKNIDFDVCKFGLQMAFEVGINIVIAIVISVALKMFRYGILFLVLFSLLRAFAGGLHLKKFWSCTALSSIIFAMVLIVVKHINIPSIISFIFIVILGMQIFAIGPIDDKNRRLSKEEFDIFHHRLAYLLMFFVLLSALNIILDKKRLNFIMLLTMSVFYLSQIVGKNKNARLSE